MRGWAFVGSVLGVALAASVASALVVAPETEVDLPVAGNSAATGDQYSPSIVALGPNKGYFAIWYDRRGIRPGIYGSRIDTAGNVLDATGIAIATGVGYTTPSIAASDTGFLVTWAVSYVDQYQQPGVYAVRLDAAAAVLDTAPIVLAPNLANVQTTRAAFGGGEWLVTWTGYGSSTSNDIAGMRVSPAGKPLDAAPIAIANSTESEYQQSVLFDGTSFLVSYRANQSAQGRLVGLDGQPDAAPIVYFTANSFGDVNVSFDGTRYTAAWTEYVVANTSNDVHFRRFLKGGAPLDGAPQIVTSDAVSDDAARVTFDGTSTLITWNRAGQLVGQRIGIDPAPIPIATGAYYDYQIASDRGGSVALNREYSGSQLIASDVKGVRIGTTPSAAAQFLVSKAANAETQPSVAWNGTAHFAAWLDTRNGQAEIWGAKIDANGKAEAAQKLVGEPNLSELTRPRVATDGTNWLVVFYSTSQTSMKRGVRGLLIEGNGKPDAAGPFDIANVPFNGPGFEVDREPDVAFDGTSYLVVWEQQLQDSTAIVGSRVLRGTKTPTDAQGLRISPRDPVQRRGTPSIAFDGTSYFVAWVTSRPTPNSIDVTHISGTRVSKEGTALDGELAVCTAFLLQRAPSVAGDPKQGGFMVAWEDYRTALDTADVYGARISAEGQNLDGPSGAKISAGPQDESAPRVTTAGDGANFIVAWRDLRSNLTYDLYGAWISRAGTNHDPNGLVLSAELGDEEAPALSVSSDSKTLAVYQRLDPNGGYGSYRIRTRAVDGGLAVATACTKNDDCASRSCADGVCCSTECGGCGVCNVTPGTCTARAAGAEAATCPAYKCKGTIACPSHCDTDVDCATSSTCDPTNHTCVSRIICIDDHTLKDLTGKQTDCAPFKCTGDACRTQCGSVDDCAEGFVCDLAARCVPAPDGGDTSGCNTSGSNDVACVGGLAWVLAAVVRRQKVKSTRS